MISARATCGKAFIHAGSAHLSLIAAVMVVTLALLASACGHHAKRASRPLPPRPATTSAARGGTKNISVETGIASWYGDPYHGRHSASGEIFDKEKMTAAHRTLPFETWVCVVNLENGKSVEVRINDRGPFIDGRIIDLSQAAAREIGLLRSGIAQVRVQVVDPPDAETIAASHSVPPRPATSHAAITQPMREQPVPTMTRQSSLSNQSASNQASLPQPVPASVASSSTSYEPSPTQAAEVKWFAVQVGVFSDRDRAEELAAVIAKLVGDARVIPTVIPNVIPNENSATSWRVIAGRQLPLVDATALARRLWREPIDPQQSSSAAEVVVEPSPY